RRLNRHRAARPGRPGRGARRPFRGREPGRPRHPRPSLPPPRLAVLDHVNLAVTDLERSRRFYAEVLGLRELERPPYPLPGAWFEVGDGMLHLSVVERAPANPDGPIDSREGHFALRVDDFDAKLESLRSRGYAEHADGDLRLQMNPYAAALV